MDNNLQVRRLAVLRELDRINREIHQSQKTITRLANQIAMIQSSHAKAA